MQASTQTPQYALAQSILGRDFISPENIQKHRKGIVYTDEQLRQFGNTVPSQEVLEWCRDNGYMMIAGPNRPMSLLEVHSLKKNYFCSKEGGWYAKQAFAENDKVDTRWIMLRKDLVKGSILRDWNEQQALLSENEVTPNAAEVAWCVTTFKSVRNIYLLLHFYVRTSSRDSDGDHVSMGHFGTEGLSFYYWDNQLRNMRLGVSAMRK